MMYPKADEGIPVFHLLPRRDGPKSGAWPPGRPPPREAGATPHPATAALHSAAATPAREAGPAPNPAAAAPHPAVGRGAWPLGAATPRGRSPPPGAREESRHELGERPPPRGRQEAAREVGGRRREGEGRCGVAGCRGRIAARLSSAASGEKGHAGPSLRAEEVPPGRRPRAEKLAGEQCRGGAVGWPGGQNARHSSSKSSGES